MAQQQELASYQRPLSVMNLLKLDFTGGKSSDWRKSLQVFGVQLRKASVASLGSVGTFANGRRASRLSEIFGVCGPAPAADANLDTIAEQDPLPTKKAMDELLNLVVMDKTRNKTPFADLVKSTRQRRNVVIFIRHFFCPVCQIHHPPDEPAH